MDFSRLAERRIEEAVEAGELDDLAGAGRPLPRETPHGDPLEVAGYRLMARAGALPPEILLKKEIAKERDSLKRVTEPALREAKLRQIAMLEMRLAMMLEQRR